MKVVFRICLLVMLVAVVGCGESVPSEEAVEAVVDETVEEVIDTGVVEPIARVERLRVATTTSLYDTGLWGYLEPMFEEASGIELDVLYAGTGKAIDWGKRGDVDVITVHSRSREEAFVAEGYGLERVPFAYNYFLIVGPASDPARIADLPPELAFQAIMASGEATFVSRGDDSGTHGKEKAIWASAGFDYENDVRNAGAWYVEGGSGMGPTLVMADEMQAYTLTDIGTFLTYHGDIDLIPLVDRGEILLNVYSVLLVNETRNPEVSQALVEFLTSPDVQELIGNYGLETYGRQLFIPCAGTDM